MPRAKGAKVPKAPAKTGVLVARPSGQGKLWRGRSPNPPIRNGPAPDAIRARLAQALDADGVPFIADLLAGVVRIRFAPAEQFTEADVAACKKAKLNNLAEQVERCRQAKAPANITELLELVPSADTRLRAVDVAARYSIGAKEDRLTREQVTELVRRYAEVTLAVVRNEMQLSDEAVHALGSRVQQAIREAGL